MKKFRTAVYDLLVKIPNGNVATYGQLAAILDRPKSARAIGKILHQNLNVKIPCWRVVNYLGKLSKNYCFGKITGQKRLLEKDNIKVINNMIDLRKYQWNNKI